MVKQKLFYVFIFVAHLNYSSICTIVPNRFGIDFVKSMKESGKWDIKKFDSKWHAAIKLYNRYIINNRHFDKIEYIPKIIHHIWLGGKLPDACDNFRKTWLKHHPNWTFIFWTDNPINFNQGNTIVKNFENLQNLLNKKKEQYIVVDIRNLSLINRILFNQCTNLGQKSDILRYEILYNLGGLYIDTDFECLKPVDIFHHLCDFYAGVAHDEMFTVFNGLIGSISQHKILKKAIDSLPRYSHKNDILSASGPYFFGNIIAQEIQKSDIGRCVLFPITYFYPWPHWLKKFNHPEQIKRWIKPETYAIHYWYQSW